MNTNTKHGFTLIELLAVIAIIGILAGVVTMNLTKARDHARDKSAIASMENLLIEGRLYKSRNNFEYEDFCADEAKTQRESLVEQLEALTSNTLACADDADAFVASVELRSGETYCVDSTNYRGIVSDSVTGTACPE